MRLNAQVEHALVLHANVVNRLWQVDGSLPAILHAERRELADSREHIVGLGSGHLETVADECGNAMGAAQRAGRTGAPAQFPAAIGP